MRVPFRWYNYSSGAHNHVARIMADDIKIEQRINLRCLLLLKKSTHKCFELLQGSLE